MFGLGAGELLIVTIIVVFLFGAKKLPALGEAFGKSINSFKKGLKEEETKTVEGQSKASEQDSKDS